MSSVQKMDGKTTDLCPLESDETSSETAEVKTKRLRQIEHRFTIEIGASWKWFGYVFKMVFMKLCKHSANTGVSVNNFHHRETKFYLRDFRQGSNAHWAASSNLEVNILFKSIFTCSSIAGSLG